MNKKRRGSTFIVVIGVLGIILIASTLFMSSTVDEGRNTAKSVKGVQTSCLAEAAVERAMEIIASQSNNIDPKKTSKDSLAVLLRLPAKVKSGVTLGLKDNLGSDELLDLNSAVTKDVVLTEKDLQKGDKNKELDNLVKYMTNGGAKSYKIKITMKVDKAFHISAGKEFPKYKVPGVDIPWNLRPDVKSFLEGKGYTFFSLQFPKTMSWLNFSIPVSIGPINIVNINVTGILDKIMPKITIGGKAYGFKDLTSLDFFADELVNKLFKAKKPYTYPFTIKVGKIIPTNISSLWPSGTTLDTSDGVCLEKYGQIKIKCEASITYKNGYTSKRRVEAVKGFKVADCEPPAPMYSLFISNLANDYLNFNNYGGQFIVNNFDFGGTWGEIKDVFTGSKKALTSKQIKDKECPGLIRINYKDTSTDKENPLVVNASIIGDPHAPQMSGDKSNSSIKKIFSGMDALLLLSSKAHMNVMGGRYNINAQVLGRVPTTQTPIPSGMAGSQVTKPPAAPHRYTVKVFTSGSYEVNKTAQLLKNINPVGGGIGGINLVPNIGGMSTNVFQFGIAIALKPMVDQVLSPSVAGMSDCFQKWDMPYMGTSNWLYTLPSHGLGMNKTHLFGDGSMCPTLTREIEGDVVKRYRRWKMCIIGLNLADRVLPFPPYMMPVPIPVWYTGEMLCKYDYNLQSLKARDKDNNMDQSVHMYDPSEMENMPPNLYTNEQYVKKATYYYKTFADFMKDYPNRTVQINGKKVFVLNGVTYISGPMGSSKAPFNPNAKETDKTFYVTGQGMIVCSGNLFLGCNIETLDKSANDRTIYSTIVRSGGLLCLQNKKQYLIEGSLYTDKGIYLMYDSSLRIIGNWVTNKFNKVAMGGKIVIDYVSSKVRSSLGSLHPTKGKFDPKRYHVSFSPTWDSWRED